MSSPNPEEWSKLDLIQKALSEFDKGMNEQIPSIPDPDVQQMFRSMQSAMRENGEKFLAELPKFEAECARIAAETKAYAEAAMREPEPPPEEKPEAIPVDLELGARLRAEVLQHYLGAPVAQETAPQESPRTLEPEDFWSASLSLLSTVAPPTPRQSTRQSEAQKPTGSFDSWLGFFDAKHDSNPPLSQ